MPKKKDLPAMPWYWGDWFKAPDVRSLPRETRCVWFEMLGLMWESNERGYLTINSKPMSDFAKANALGFGEEVDKYLAQEKLIEETGLFSRRENDNAIFSRKILKDLELREKRQNSGSQGGKASAKRFAKANGIANTEYETETINEGDSLKKRGLLRGEIISELNNVLGTNYKPDSKESVQLIDARLAQGFTVADFFTVIDKKAKEWRNDAKMQKFLRPKTLFSGNFEGYLNQLTGGTKNDGKPKTAREIQAEREYPESFNADELTIRLPKSKAVQ